MKLQASHLMLGLCLLLLPAALMAQQNPATMDNSAGAMASNGQAMGQANGQSVTATGCLQKGTEPGGYYLTGADGKTWELTGPGLASHVGHKVTVTGQQTEKSKSHEEKMEASEKSEAGGNQYGDLHVSNVQMVSADCQ